jgi:hypothetical protein
LALRLDELHQGELIDAIERFSIEYGLKAEEMVKKLMTTRLKPRTGRLRASVKLDIKRTTSAVRVILKAGNKKNVPYAVTHEYGATIKAKPGKWLRIPLPNARTSAGVDRFSTPLRQTGKGKFYAAKSKKGNLLLFDRKTNKPWYVLKKQSKIPKRPTFAPTFKYLDDKMIPELEDFIVSLFEV